MSDNPFPFVRNDRAERRKVKTAESESDKIRHNDIDRFVPPCRGRGLCVSASSKERPGPRSGVRSAASGARKAWPRPCRRGAERGKRDVSSAVRRQKIVHGEKRGVGTERRRVGNARKERREEPVSFDPRAARRSAQSAQDPAPLPRPPADPIGRPVRRTGQHPALRTSCRHGPQMVLLGGRERSEPSSSVPKTPGG